MTFKELHRCVRQVCAGCFTIGVELEDYRGENPRVVWRIVSPQHGVARGSTTEIALIRFMSMADEGASGPSTEEALAAIDVE